MGWLNVFGLIMIVVIMIPNIIFAIRCKEGFENKWNNKLLGVAEQIGRFGCLGFMIINIPGTWFGWWSDEALAIYLIVDTTAFEQEYLEMINRWEGVYGKGTENDRKQL